MILSNETRSKEERDLLPDHRPGPRAEPDSHPLLQHAPPVLHAETKFGRKVSETFLILLWKLNQHKFMNSGMLDLSEKMGTSVKGGNLVLK